MPRPADPAKRRDLLAQVRAYLRHNGLANLSLRPLARALGTSDRMLLYYFGTKEQLVAEALSIDERRPLLRFQDVLGAVGTPQDAAGVRRVLEEVWRRFRTPDRRAVLPLTFEVMTASMLRPERYGPLAHEALTEWTQLLTTLFTGVGMPEARARNEATVVVDALLGLLFASAALGGEEHVDAAFHTLLDRLEPAWRTPR
ncbi:TetR/AcrR family transcriptional regulator [Streptomyces sp. NPDC056411]|uniref:TetR/AcrR family transcriptional regulator n=1 Tax=Streptomyces sp. NPDC056411 TaxID=3345813 RepID=UPI0035DBD558